MSDILTKINARKKEEIALRKTQVPVSVLEKSDFFGTLCYSLQKELVKKEALGIIAEFKRKSPSKGLINATSDVVEVTKGYIEAGASALSVLTDTEFFGGSFALFSKARSENRNPILQKDFIVDEYQVVEAKSLGADVILLIAASLSRPEVKMLAGLAGSLGMEVLLEVHNEKELDHYCPEISLIGVNSRNLKTFEVDIQTAINLAPLLPPKTVRIAESGISDPVTVKLLRHYGYKGFLIGETFMKTADPAQACRDFIKRLNE